VGVICEQVSKIYLRDYFQEPCTYDVAQELGLPVLTIEQVTCEHGEAKIDLAFSCRAPYILKPAFLSRFRKGVVNFHGGPLPEMRGVHNANHAIISGRDQFAATLHYMDEGIDTGPVIAKRYFPIGPHDTAFDVFQNTQKMLWCLFRSNIDAILEDREQAMPQQALTQQCGPPKYFDATALEALKIVDLTMSPIEIYRRVRGCDFPGHEPAYYLVEGRKVYLTTQEFFKK